MHFLREMQAIKRWPERSKELTDESLEVDNGVEEAAQGSAGLGHFSRAGGNCHGSDCHGMGTGVRRLESAPVSWDRGILATFRVRRESVWSGGVFFLPSGAECELR